MLFSIAVKAQDDYSLFIVQADNSSSYYQLSTLKKISFENGNVVLHSTTGEKTTTAMSSVGSMYIAPTATSVELVHSDGTIAWDGTTLRVNQGSATEQRGIPLTSATRRIYHPYRRSVTQSSQEII